ncbi:unnamed protein product [Brachionus calyciflorus]|uniref:Enoyl-[acyl-carrier-protein] reductase, mitochondrial n=1 Tax=Brachionus calyciflorus TaxID=104777 RepID=A0A813NM87_9BILA|nr:unnamed protein product [Brachionus calyciflorus]
MLFKSFSKGALLISRTNKFFSSLPSGHTINCTELLLKDYGTIDKALELKQSNLDQSKIGINDLLVKLICAPINPADVNIIQGKYGILPTQLPSLIGNEGLFEVVETHADNSEFKKGDWVLPIQSNWGTWRSHAIANQNLFYKIPNNLDKYACATIKVNPCTAYLMLTQFKNLKPNETIIQNGANSAVGQAVIQLGNLMNINVVNIVRKRENQQELNDYLKTLGAKYIFTEDELRKSFLTQELWKEIPRPRFALNCVGGRATTDMIRLLDKDSIMITYGGMSKQPLTLNTADFIFKNFKCFGFWLTTWKKQNPEEFKKVLDRLLDFVAKNQLKGPKCEEFSFSDYVKAFERVQTPFVNTKICFTS